MKRGEAAGIALLVLVAAVGIVVATAVAVARLGLGAAGRNLAWATASCANLSLALVVVFAIVVVWRRTPPEALGLAVDKRALGTGGAGVGFGAASALAAFLVAWAAGGYAVAWAAPAERPTLAWEASALVALGLGAAFEEVVFRAGLAGTLARAFPRWVAVVAPAVVFAAAHLMNPHVSAAAEANIVLAGLVLGLLYFDPWGAGGGASAAPTLGLCTGWHLGWNATLDALGIPVSGNALGEHLLRVTPLSSSWSGGAFGVEAGLGTTFVLAALAAFLGLRQRGAKLSVRA